MKILIINNNCHIAEFKEYYISYLSIQRSLNIWERIIKKIPVINRIIPKTYWEKNNWEQCCRDKNVIILFDQFKKNHSITQKIENSCPKSCRLIIYYWNPYFFTEDNDLLSVRWEKWSFSKKDAEQFKMQYAGTFFSDFYLKENIETTDCINKKQKEAFFVGLDKGRSTILQDLSKLLTQRNVYCNFVLVHNFYSYFLKKYSKRLTYAQVLEKVRTCDFLIDIVQKKQEGLTQRVMESLFFKKKILTNNYEIVSYDFYNSNNVYILDKDNPETLDSFLSTDYVELDSDLVNQYRFTQWLDRILKNISNN